MTDDDTPARPRFQGRADGGAANLDHRRHNTRQLNEHDLKHMSPDEIVAAEDDGQFDELLGRGDFNLRYRD